ncbi:MAG: hypothetical protein V1913_15075 [Fibrobacterota bacterium]
MRKPYVILLVSVFCLFTCTFANPDSLQFLEQMQQAESFVAQGDSSLLLMMGAARDLADAGLFSDAALLLDSVLSVDVAEMESTALPDEGPPSTVTGSGEKKWNLSVSTGADYYGFENSDSSIYYLYGDTLATDMAAVPPLDYYMDAAYEYRPGCLGIRRIAPYIRIGRLSRHERLQADFGYVDSGFAATLKEEGTVYLGRMDKDSSDQLEVSGEAGYGWIGRFKSVDILPRLDMTVDAQKYRVNRPGYVSNMEIGLRPAVEARGEAYTVGLSVGFERQCHPLIFDSLDRSTVAPHIFCNAEFDRLSLNLFGGAEGVRQPSRNTGNDANGSLELSLNYEAAPGLDCGLSAEWSGEKSAYSDTLYQRSDSLYYFPPTPAFGDTSVPFEAGYRKYALSGSVFALTPSLRRAWTDVFTTTFEYRLERGVYAKLSSIDKLRLEYPVPALEDSYLLNRLKILFSFFLRNLDASFGLAYESANPQVKEPMEPPNTAVIADGDWNWEIMNGWNFNGLFEIERRHYAPAGQSTGHGMGVEAQASTVLNRTLSMALKKSF